ncbi:MAG: HAMP domain-containing sensor histidine kinase [Caldilineaceae bacterium]|nr:HAMP domain-containing sensor histidine kinase [Caldilineaceae bacterium]
MSLGSKLSIAFVAIAVLGILVAGALGIWNTVEFHLRKDFEARTLPFFLDEVLAHYQAHDKSWAAAGELSLPEYVLLFDEDQKWLGNDRRGPAQKLLGPLRGYGIPAQAIVLDGEVIGFLKVTHTPKELGGGVEATFFQEDAAFLEDEFEDLEDYRWNGWPIPFWGFGAILLAVGMSGVFVSRRIVGPLHELTDATRAVASGELDHRVPVRSQDELGMLAESFNSMSRKLAESEQLKRQMTQDVVHDLAQPIVVIRGLAEAMRDGAIPATNENLDTIFQEAGRVEGLVRGLHVLEQLDAGRLQLSREPLAPARLVERLMRMYAGQAQGAGISLTARVEPNLPVLSVDGERLIQVLGNIVVNALTHAPADSEIEIQARTAPDGGVELSVTDGGPGVKEEDLPRIFERFYRADKARTQTGGNGSGIGLAIVRSLVEAHGGRAFAANIEPNGLRVSVWLPPPSQLPLAGRAEGS